MSLRRWGACAFAAVVVTSAGCGGDAPVVQGMRGSQIAQLEIRGMPSEVTGLRVVTEDASAAVRDATRSFADALALYSLRSDQLVMATLQVSRLLEGADHTNIVFRRSIVEQSSGSGYREARLGRDTVWLTRATKSKVAIWFRDRYVFQLTLREEFDEPRNALRRLLEAEP